MKRKFLSIAVCLMFCLTSMFMLSACGEEKPVVVAQHDAETAMNTAMETLAQSTTIKMTMSMPMGMGDMVIIASEEQAYVEMAMAYEDEEYSYDMLVSSWTELEEDAYVTYSYMSMTEDGETEEVATKSISLLADSAFDNEYAGDAFEGLDFDNFVKASKLDGELSIVFKDEEGTKFTAKIEDNKLVSIKITEGLVSMTMYIHYGDFAEEIPTRPEKDWVLSSTIEIPELKETYVQGEDIEDVKLSLVGLELELYEEGTGFDPDATITITEEMLEKISVTGFDASTVTTEPREMTITYLGIELVVEYEVVAPAEG